MWTVRRGDVAGLYRARGRLLHKGNICASSIVVFCLLLSAAGAGAALGVVEVPPAPPPPATTQPPPPITLLQEVEEFFVEHEISSAEARQAARQLRPEQIVLRRGCDTCTRREMEYCAGTRVMTDHCCCDKRFTEVFPYVPHTCHRGATRCTTIAENCAEYARLRTCCCDVSMQTKWKAIMIGSSSDQLLPSLVLLAASTILLIMTTLQHSNSL